MAERDDHAQDGGFKVTDRRKFTMDGELRPEVAAELATGAAPQKETAPAPAPASKQEAQRPSRPAAPPAAPAEEEYAEAETPFERLVVSLTSTAMMQLGLVALDPGQPLEPDLPGARETIDMLGVLEEKTRGNLTSRESRLLRDTLTELRMTFVEVQKRKGARR